MKNSILINAAKVMRRQTLIQQEQFDRVVCAGGGVAYTSGERWRNNKQYLADDTIKDGNGNIYTAKTNSINKTPANNPEYWAEATS